jgi:hypothetical protein
MTNRNDTDTIEAGIERDRASLAATIGALHERVSVEHLAQEALGFVKTSTATYTRSIDKAARANPLALALTGVGIAWLIFGNRKTETDEDPIRSASATRPSEDGDQPLSESTASTMVDPASAADVTGENRWSDEIDRLRDHATTKLHEVETEARRHAGSVGKGISEHLGKARDFATERKAVLSGLADDMKHGFRQGLEDLSDAARDQIVAAREQAYAAKIRAERLARSGVRDTSRLIEDHPLIAGVVALAAGAAFAAALPRTRVEDRAFGAESDRLMAQANDLLRQERARISRVASGVADEATHAARDTAETVSDGIRAAADTVETVKDRDAKEAAKPSSAASRGEKGGKRKSD